MNDEESVMGGEDRIDTDVVGDGDKSDHDVMGGEDRLDADVVGDGDKPTAT